MAANRIKIKKLRRPEADICEHISSNAIYWSKGPQVLISDTIDGPTQRLARIPRPFLRRLLATTRLGRRLARETFYNIIPLRDGSLFYTYANEIGFIDPNGGVRQIGGRTRAHRVLRGGVCILPDDSIVFGEYFDNPERAPVRLYRVRPGEMAVREVYRFPSGTVRHVHSVRWDPISRRAIVSTGDLESECHIFAFDPNFTDFQTLGEGSENWRTISPQFGIEAIYFGTDAQFSQNCLLRYDRASGKLTELAQVNGPVFYSAPLPGGWIFATTAELCLSQTSPEAILYYIDAANETVSIVASFTKDRLSTRYFQFGILNLPINSGPQARLPISGVALKGLDAEFVEVSVEA